MSDSRFRGDDLEMQGADDSSGAVEVILPCGANRGKTQGIEERRGSSV
jgi:hypothetical protein